MRLAAALLSTLLFVETGRCVTFVVPPGPGTPVQDAIDAASPGDTIRLTLGSYPEHLVIEKRLNLFGVRSASPDPNVTSVGGGCTGGGPTISIFGDGVQLRRVQVLSDNAGGIRVVGTHVNLNDVFVGSPCEVVSAPRVNVESGNRVTLTRVWAVGTPTKNVPAGIRIADIVPDGRVRVRKASAGHDDIGILLENDGARSVRITSSNANFNVRGIVLRGTSGVQVDHNRLIDNSTSGIEIEATSSGNSVIGNAASGSTNDVADYGTANCWHNNKFTTGSVPPCP
jgi:parallel beta-helix repeat protein